MRIGLHTSMNGKKWLLTTFFLTAFLIAGAAVVRYKGENVNYYNSDATWHILLTMHAYEETPVSEHLFLPIVSLGAPDDKWIAWGATVPSSSGNYYYTSFSPAGFFMPWLFVKIFALPISEKSLYLYNTILFVLSAFLWVCFIYTINAEYRKTLSVIALTSYVLSPELLHGMGVVYWHQSLMQVTLLIQIMAWFFYKKNHSRVAGILFYTLAVLNPYIEWTGYIANIGFAIAEFFPLRKTQWKKAFCSAAWLGGLTVMSFAAFTFHYLLRVSRGDFLNALQARFMSRNITSQPGMFELLLGYLKSFHYLWVLLFILLAFHIIVRRRIVLHHKLLMFVMLFPMLENILMQQHAIQYTYDRMKGIYFLSFIICELTGSLLSGSKKKYGAGILILSVLFFGTLNLWSYINDSSYIWKIDYRDDNLALAEFIEQEYPDSVIATENVSVRGYMNLLFERGIYEYKDEDAIKEIAKAQEKRYAVMLVVESPGEWDMHRLQGAVIYDLRSGAARRIAIKNGEVYDL